MYKKITRVLSLFEAGSEAVKLGQTDQVKQLEKLQALEIPASQATRGHLRGYREGTTVQRPTHYN
jgi:hypothetical protein